MYIKPPGNKKQLLYHSSFLSILIASWYFGLTMSGATPYDFSYAARDVILNMTLIESLGFGLYSAVFWFTLYWLLFNRQRDRGAPRRLSTLFIIIPLYVLAIIHLMVRWTVTRLAFVVHGQTSETVLNGFLFQPQWCIVLSVVSFSMSSLIADFVTVWRCWMIWNRNWKVAAVPFLLVVTGTAFCILGAIYQIEPNVLSTSHFNKFAEFLMIYFIFSLASMTISTTLMIYRIAAVGRITGFHLENTYRKVAEIIVESAALYCMALVIYLPFLVRDDFSSGYSEAILSTITGIAPTIISGRVALGVARDYSTAPQSGNIGTFVFAPVMGSTDSPHTDCLAELGALRRSKEEPVSSAT